MLSIIVPVYNAEKTLARTLDSIQGQLYKDWECILVNDGSKDNSLAICQQYASQDSRFKFVDQPNGGVSSARNKGLEMAQGNFIAFCDADDVLEPVMYEQLVGALLKYEADVAACNYISEDELSKFKNSVEPFFILDKPLNYTYEDEFQVGLLCNKVFRRLLLNKLCFNLTVKYSEDLLFVAQALANCKNIAVTKATYYHYINYPTSGSKQLGNYELWSGYVEAMKTMLEIVEQNNCQQHCIEKAREKYAISVFSLLRLAIISRDRIAYDRYLAEYRELLNNFMNSSKVKMGKKLCYWSYCQGYGFASLIHYYLKRR